MRIVFVRFLEEIDDPINLFEINLPLLGDEIGSGLSSMAVCFDFRSTNLVQLSILRLPKDHRRQPVTEPKPISLHLNRLCKYLTSTR